MSHLMKHFETLRRNAASKIEKALGLCMGFADRARAVTCSRLPN
jgi:hypothetical protein